jgi:hypothetical protein
MITCLDKAKAAGERRESHCRCTHFQRFRCRELPKPKNILEIVTKEMSITRRWPKNENVNECRSDMDYLGFRVWYYDPMRSGGQVTY